MKYIIFIAVIVFIFGCNSSKSCQEIVDAIDDGKLSSSSEEAQGCFDYAYEICLNWMTRRQDMGLSTAEEYCKRDPWRVL